MNRIGKAHQWSTLTRKVIGGALIGLGGLMASAAASAAVIIDINTYVTGNPVNPGTATVARLTFAQIHVKSVDTAKCRRHTSQLHK